MSAYWAASSEVKPWAAVFTMAPQIPEFLGIKSKLSILLKYAVLGNKSTTNSALFKKSISKQIAMKTTSSAL